MIEFKEIPERRSCLHKKAILSAAISCLLIHSGADAQNALMEEVVVSAQKRSASAQDVPLAITAIGGDTARDLGWDSAEEIIDQAANVSLDDSGQRTSPQYRIRGLGDLLATAAGQSPVGVYIDEVYINNLQGRGAALFDMDRVEVLRGPQGTLWGKNTTAGAVHFVTQKPTEEFGGYGSITIGNLDGGTQWVTEGAVGGGLADNIAGRIAFKVEDSDNWINNRHPEGSDTGGYESTAVRGSLLFTPSDDLDITVTASYSDYEGAVETFHVIGTSSYGYVEPPGAGHDTNTAFEDIDNAEVTNLTLSLNWRVGDLTLSSVTGYVDVDALTYHDGDFSPVDGVNWHKRVEADQFSQEIRLASPEDQSLRWIVGGYYFTENLNADYDLNLSSVQFAPFPGVPSLYDLFILAPTPSGFVRGIDSGVSNSHDERVRESYAVFGSLEADLTENLTLNAGLRWTYDEEDIEADLDHFVLQGNFGSKDFASRRNEYDGVTHVDERDEKEDWNEWTGDLTLNWSYNDSSLAYLRYARGYRAGQFNTSNTQPFEFGVVNPEFLDAYEVGLKTSLLDGKLQLNGAAYFYDYTDIQTFVFDPLAGGAVMINAGEAEVKGLEFDLKYSPIDALFISLGFGYSDTEYTKVLPGTDGAEEGNEFAFSPNLTANTLIQYSVFLSSGATLRLQTDWNYQSDAYGDGTNDPKFKYDGRTLGNASVSYETQDALTLSLWVKNLTDEEYFTSVQDHPAGVQGTLGDPLSFGVSVYKDF